MVLSEVPHGASIALDSNVFIYHFCGRSRQSTELLRAVEMGVYKGLTTREALQEVLHRLMVIEVQQMGIITGANPARALKKKPAQVGRLTRYYRDTMAILSIGIRVLPPLPHPIRSSHPLRERFGLLTNDSILAATVLHAGIKILATGDRDFQSVDDLEVLLIDDIQ